MQANCCRGYTKCIKGVVEYTIVVGLWYRECIMYGEFVVNGSGIVKSMGMTELEAIDRTEPIWAYQSIRIPPLPSTRVSGAGMRGVVACGLGIRVDAHKSH